MQCKSSQQKPLVGESLNQVIFVITRIGACWLCQAFVWRCCPRIRVSAVKFIPREARLSLIAWNYLSTLCHFRKLSLLCLHRPCINANQIILNRLNSNSVIKVNLWRLKRLKKKKPNLLDHCVASCPPPPSPFNIVLTLDPPIVAGLI